MGLVPRRRSEGAISVQIESALVRATQRHECDRDLRDARERKRFAGPCGKPRGSCEIDDRDTQTSRRGRRNLRDIAVQFLEADGLARLRRNRGW
jgi:hypothetical protein